MFSHDNLHFCNFVNFRSYEQYRMPGIVRFSNWNLFLDVWEICVGCQVTFSHCVLLGAHSIFLHDDVELLVLIGMLEGAILDGSASVHWL